MTRAVFSGSAIVPARNMVIGSIPSRRLGQRQGELQYQSFLNRANADRIIDLAAGIPDPPHAIPGFSDGSPNAKTGQIQRPVRRVDLPLEQWLIQRYRPQAHGSLGEIFPEIRVHQQEPRPMIIQADQAISQRPETLVVQPNLSGGARQHPMRDPTKRLRYRTRSGKLRSRRAKSVKPILSHPMYRRRGHPMPLLIAGGDSAGGGTIPQVGLPKTVGEPDDAAAVGRNLEDRTVIPAAMRRLLSRFGQQKTAVRGHDRIVREFPRLGGLRKAIRKGFVAIDFPVAVAILEPDQAVAGINEKLSFPAIDALRLMQPRSDPPPLQFG